MPISVASTESVKTVIQRLDPIGEGSITRGSLLKSLFKSGLNDKFGFGSDG